MGAMAISVVAGARIVEMEDAPMVNATRGLVAGLSVVCWSFATWLIPALIAAGWELSDDGTAITKTFRFKGFRDAMAWMAPRLRSNS